MLRRVLMYKASDLDALAGMVAAVEEPIVLVFDADNTLVRQGIALDGFQRGVTEAIKRFKALATVKRVIILTNGPERGVPGMIHRGNKPVTAKKRLGLSSTDRPMWVVGDQMLTDGLLAWRLGATFVHLEIAEAEQSRLERRLRRLFFTDGRGRP